MIKHISEFTGAEIDQILLAVLSKSGAVAVSGNNLLLFRSKADRDEYVQDPTKTDLILDSCDLQAASRSALLDGMLVPALANNLKTDDYLVNTTQPGGDDDPDDNISDNFIIRSTGGNLSVSSGVAEVRSLRGNAVIWNQHLANPNFDEFGAWYIREAGSVSVADNVCIYVAAGGTAQYRLYQNLTPKASHKYYYAFDEWVETAYTGRIFIGFFNGNSTAKIDDISSFAHTTTRKRVTGIITASGTITNFGIAPYSGHTAGTTWHFANFILIDLTDLFGAGNEPTTAEAVETAIRKLTGSLAPYYAYDTGSLKTFSPTALKATGFNQWDEVWEAGALNANTGANQVSVTDIRSKNYIPALPNTLYYLKAPATTIVCCYDGNKNFIGRINYGSSNKVLTATPSNCAFIRFCTYGTTITTYNHDICLNLHWTGYTPRYEPYEEHVAAIDVSSIVDGQGNQLFPHGLLRAGTAYDEIKDGKAIKRIVVVDLGNLPWEAETASSRAYWAVAIPGMKQNSNQTSPWGYTYETYAVNAKTYTTRQLSAGYTLYVRNSGEYASVDDFKAAMSGIPLACELTTPVEVDLPASWNGKYICNDFGTEEFVGTEIAPYGAEFAYLRDLKNQLRNHLDRHAEEWASLLELERVDSEWKMGKSHGYDEAETTLNPNELRDCGTITADPNFSWDETEEEDNPWEGKCPQYMCQFTIGSGWTPEITFPATVRLPAAINWEVGKTYQVRIINNLASVGVW